MLQGKRSLDNERQVYVDLIVDLMILFILPKTKQILLHWGHESVESDLFLFK